MGPQDLIRILGFRMFLVLGLRVLSGFIGLQGSRFPVVDGFRVFQGFRLAV